MQRRHFLQLIATAALAAPGTPRPIVRTSRLYPERPKSQTMFVVMPQVMALDDKIISLHSSTLTATTPAGDVLWEYPVLAGPFGGLVVSGDAILVTSFNGRIQRLDPRTGENRLLGPKWYVSGRVFPVGGGRFVSLQRFQIDFWQAGDSLTLERSISVDLPALCQVDQISNRIAAITSADQDSVWLVDTTTGQFSEYEIDFSGFATSPLPFRATGADRAKQLAYIVIPANNASTIVTVDPFGDVRRHGSFARPDRKFPFRVLKYGNELGIAHHDGSVAWYAD